MANLLERITINPAFSSPTLAKAVRQLHQSGPLRFILIQVNSRPLRNPRAKYDPAPETMKRIASRHS